MWHAVLHAIEETIILLPFLFVCYVLIEVVETWTSRKTSKSLSSGKLQVLAGAGIGLTVLFKANKNKKENIRITVILYAISAIFGLALMLCGVK